MPQSNRPYGYINRASESALRPENMGHQQWELSSRNRDKDHSARRAEDTTRGPGPRGREDPCRSSKTASRVYAASRLVDNFGSPNCSLRQTVIAGQFYGQGIGVCYGYCWSAYQHEIVPLSVLMIVLVETRTVQ